MRIDLIPAGDNPPESLNVLIEVPIGGEPVKYEFDKASGALFVDRFLHTPMRYHQGHAKLGQHAANTQHGAVTANDQRQVTVGPYTGHIQDRVLREPRAGRGVFFNRNITPLCIYKLRHIFQGRAGTWGVVLAD